MMKCLAVVILLGIFLGTLTMLSVGTSSVNSTDVDDDFVVEDNIFKSGECIHNVNKSGLLPLNGTINPSAQCIWNITSNSSHLGSSGLMFEDVNLDVDDILTILLNGTVIFGPYNGSVGSPVILVDEKNFTVNLTTSDKKMHRDFHIMYSENCVFAIPPSMDIIESPVYRKKEKMITCRYDYAKIHEEIMHSFVFKNFSLGVQSNLAVEADGSKPVFYKETPPPDIFGSEAKFNMTLDANFTGNTLIITRRDVYKDCSGLIELPSALTPVLRSPNALKSYDDFVKFECRWLIKTAANNNVLGLLVEKLQFSNVFDMLIINDGSSELSSPIVQATLINQNETKAKVIRTSGPYMWVSFRSANFASSFSGNYSEGQGGYYSGSGNISLSGSDGVFLLEVPSDEKVLLNFSLSTFPSFTVRIFDGFETTSSLIGELNGNVWYPVVSDTSKMRVVASNFIGGKISASFSGIKSDCIHMSTSFNDAYVVSGDCNSSCAWIVPPRNMSGGVLLLGFEFLLLDTNDVVEIYSLANYQASVAKIVYGVKHVPPLTFSPNEGFYVNISRRDCTRNEGVILIARSTYLPDCSGNFSLVPSSEVQVSSPNYPNLYPLFARCEWNFVASGSTKQFYLSFDSMKLAENHYVQITYNSTKTEVFSGDVLPNDMLILGNMNVRFDSANSSKSGVPTSLASDEGFVLNVISSDCGGIMSSKTGHFDTNVTTLKGKSSCFWIIEVPYKENDGSVNSVMFTVDEKDEAKNNNSEFHIYDGPSVHFSPITNVTGNIWSRNNTVIFVYKRFNSSVASALYTVNYKTINCNKTMQCDNGICLHPDWLCNGHNNCGDFTDEKSCETVPIPDSVKQANGVSSVVFGIVIILFFGLGVLAAFLIPKAISRYRSGRYHQFQDYPGVD